MKSKTMWSAQLFIVLLCALGLKLYYSTASPEQLRWILAPTTRLVELLSGRSFAFESHAGYMSSDHSFLIAASCAGVNFLITSFVMLALRVMFRKRPQSLTWRFIPISALFAYVATIIANTVRICVALELQHHAGISWLNANQLHRLEGIVVYFGFLLLLFMLTERTKPDSISDLFRQARLPLLIYYATTVGIPLANGAFRRGTEFWEHSAFVLVAPLLVAFLVLTLRFLSAVPVRSIQ